MTTKTPQYPITVTCYDGDEWNLGNEAEVGSTLEWFDSDDPEEGATVVDALGRPVRVKVVQHRVMTLEIAAPRDT